MDDYEKKRQEEKKTQYKLVRHAIRVLEYLGFAVEPHEADAWFVQGLKGEQKIHISIGQFGTAKRFIISGCYPTDAKNKYLAGPDHHPKITVSNTREAENIGRDIKRRFLPDYLKSLESVQDLVRKSDQYNKNCEAGLRGIIGRKPSEAEVDSRTSRIEFPGEGWADVKEVSDDSASIHVRYASHDVVKRIVDLLQGAK